MNACDQQRTLQQRTCCADETAKAIVFSEVKLELEGSCGPFPLTRGSEEVKGMFNTHEVVCQVCGVWLGIGSFDSTPTESPITSFLSLENYFSVMSIV